VSGIFGLIGAAAGLGPDKPKVPTFREIDTGTAQKTAIANNEAALPGAQKLASGVNLFNQTELLNMLKRGIPGYEEIQESESEAILSLLRGELPDANQIATKSAARAVGLGISGSDAGGNLSMRDLGIASLAATEAGLSAADRWLKTSESMTNPGLFNVASMFISPAQQIATEQSERNSKFNVDWLGAQIDAQPSYLEQQAMGTLDYFDSLGKSILSSYVGMVTGSPGTMAGGDFGTTNDKLPGGGSGGFGATSAFSSGAGGGGGGGAGGMSAIFSGMGGGAGGMAGFGM
jgi:hypothetical protein